MKKRVFLAGIIAAVMLSVPAAAETFTSADGVLSIELPNENWKEISDPAQWIALSDGANLITVDHLSNGETLPAMTVADEHYVNVFQAVFSTQNEVFIITGSVVDAAKITEVEDAILSTKILQLDTKKKIVSDTSKPAPSEFTTVATDKTMYVTSDGLNVRSGHSTSDKIIGAYAYGSTVRVTGVVQQNGADYGWYQIDYNGAAGYVSSAYLSDTAPAAKATQNNDNKQDSQITFTGTAVTVYAASGAAITIYQTTDGRWFDSIGASYTWLDSDRASNANGDVFTTYKSYSNNDTPSVTGSLTLFYLNGNAETLTQYSDGTYYSSSGVQFYDAGGGAFAGSDGSTLYVNDPQIGTAGSSLRHGLESQGSGRPVEIGSEDGSVYYDESGVGYYDMGDGTFVDDNGDVFNVVW